MPHTLDSTASLEILRHKLWTMVSEPGRAVVRDDAWPGLGKGFQRPLYDNLHIGSAELADRLPGHLLADFVMVDGAAGAIKHTAQIIAGTGKVQTGHVDVPMRVG